MQKKRLTGTGAVRRDLSTDAVSHTVRFNGQHNFGATVAPEQGDG